MLFVFSFSLCFLFLSSSFSRSAARETIRCALLWASLPHFGKSFNPPNKPAAVPRLGFGGVKHRRRGRRGSKSETKEWADRYKKYLEGK